jgi:hypothetical protein
MFLLIAPVNFSLFFCKQKLISVFDKYKLVIYVCVLYFKFILSIYMFLKRILCESDMLMTSSTVEIEATVATRRKTLQLFMNHVIFP